MSTKVLPKEAIILIEAYRYLRVGSAVTSAPYFNNKTRGIRGALAVHVGKGSPTQILEEVKTIITKKHIDTNSLADSSLKKILVDNDLGIDCSGFAYHIFEILCQNKNGKALGSLLTFNESGGFFGKLRAHLRPAENTNVMTFASEANSHEVSIQDIQPGDFISLLKNSDLALRDHILVITQVESDDTGVTKAHYMHAIRYPEDGELGSGIKEGIITITNKDGTIVDQKWTEGSRENEQNQIFLRAKSSIASLRRLNFL